MENPSLLVVGFHTPPLTATATYNFPTSILMARPWPQGILPLALAIFFDNLGCQFLAVENIYISLKRNSTHPLLWPHELNGGEFMFGHMLHLTMTPSTCITLTICHRMTGYILPNTDN
jgi:hypothetical protein